MRNQKLNQFLLHKVDGACGLYINLTTIFLLEVAQLTPNPSIQKLVPSQYYFLMDLNSNDWTQNLTNSLLMGNINFIIAL